MTSSTDTNIGFDPASKDGDWSAETTYMRNADGSFIVIGIAYRDKKGRWTAFDGLTPSQMKNINGRIIRQ